MINRVIISLLAAVVSSGVGVYAAPQSRRCNEADYNCRVQRPGGNGGSHRDSRRGESYQEYRIADFRVLFGDMRLSGPQLKRLEKAYSKYSKDMRRIQKSGRGGSRHSGASYRNDAMKCENRFVTEVRRTLDQRQYMLFERRFRSACGVRRGGSSAPRPGAFVYETEWGQGMLLADSTRQECAGEQDCGLEPQSNGIGPVVKGPAPRLVTGDKVPD